MHWQDAAVGAMQPGEHDHLIARVQAVQPVEHTRLKDEPRLGRSLMTLLGCSGQVDDGGLDPADGFQLKAPVAHR